MLTISSEATVHSYFYVFIYKARGIVLVEAALLESFLKIATNRDKSDQ